MCVVVAFLKLNSPLGGLKASLGAAFAGKY